MKAVDKVNADTIFVLPNNSNIILAAEQAKSLVEDKKLIVIPSKTVPQGITAVVNYIDGETPEVNAEHMTGEMSRVKTGQVTYAVRDTVIDDKTIKEGDIMGIGDAGLFLCVRISMRQRKNWWTPLWMRTRNLSASTMAKTFLRKQRKRWQQSLKKNIRMWMWNFRTADSRFTIMCFRWNNPFNGH